jgi:hypothetical protein
MNAMKGCYGSTELASAVPRASWRKVFMEKRRVQQKYQQWEMAAGQQDEVFCFCFSSLSGACACRGPERSRARRFGRGEAHP